MLGPGFRSRFRARIAVAGWHGCRRIAVANCNPEGNFLRSVRASKRERATASVTSAKATQGFRNMGVSDKLAPSEAKARTLISKDALPFESVLCAICNEDERNNA